MFSVKKTCFSSVKPVLTNAIGCPEFVWPTVFVLFSGILITGNLATVIGFVVVIIVILDVGSCGGVVLIIGSIFTHLDKFEGMPANDWTLTQFVICGCEKLFNVEIGLVDGLGKMIGRCDETGGEEGTMLADGGGDGYGCGEDMCEIDTYQLQ